MGSAHEYAWGMVYPHVDALPRHPNKLYQFFAEGILLFALVWWFSSKSRPRMAVSGVFVLGYGVYRFLLEFVREPDRHLGYIAFDWLTIGQLLSLPMILVGVALLVLAYRNSDSSQSGTPEHKLSSKRSGKAGTR